MYLRRLSEREILWLLLLAICVSLFHWRGIKPGNTFLPVDLANNNLPWRGESGQPLQNALISDPLYQFYPFLNEAVTTVRDEHQWPLWNSQIMLGHPSVGDPLAQPFFPLFLLLSLVFGVARGFGIGLWLLAVIAAGLTYGWLRIVGCKQLAAFAGAMTYALSGYMITWFETTFWLSTLALLPGVLMVFEMAWREKSPLYVALASLLMGLAILGGQLTFIIIFVIFFGLYALGRAIESRRKKGTSSILPIYVFVIVVGLGALLSSVLVLPAVEVLNLSRRSGGGGATDALPWQQLITLVIPNFYGTPVAPFSYWGLGNFAENTIYAGIVALLLACLAPFTDRKFFTVFMAGIAVGTTYLVLGGPGVALLGRLPGINFVSLHRTSFILPLLIAFLAAATLNATIISFRSSLIISLIFAGFVLLVFFFDSKAAASHWELLRSEVIKAAILLGLTLSLIWIAARWPKYQQLTRWGIIILIFVDLSLFGRQFNPAGPIKELMPATEAIDFLQQSQPQRVVALQRNDRVLFGPNILSLFDIAEAGGYSSLVVDRYHQLVSAGDPELDVWWMKRQGNMVTFSSPTTRLLDLFQVSHLASAVPMDTSMVRTEIAMVDCKGESEAITNTQPLGGSFTVQETAINRLDFSFLIGDSNLSEPANLVIRLWQDAKDGRLVLEEERPLTGSSTQEDVVVFFAPETHAPGQTYVWEVSTDAQQLDAALCLGENGQPAVGVYGSDWHEVYQGELFIYERLAPMPRAYVVYAAENIDSEAETVQRLLDEDFPIRQVAVTETSDLLPVSTEIPATPASITEYTDTKVIVQANSAAEGLLILGDQFHPGWQVTVDGQPAPLLRVNHIFRGVRLPPGEHEIVFKFNPQSLQIGMLLSGIGIALVLVVAILGIRRAKITVLSKSAAASHP